jgi:hypothetical protein
MQILTALAPNDGGRRHKVFGEREVCLMILVKMFSYSVSTINFILYITFVDNESVM